MTARDRFHAIGGGGGGGGGLSFDTKSLGADTAGFSALTTILTSADLATGTWLVTWSAQISSTSAHAEVGIVVNAGTATATFLGAQAATALVSDLSNVQTHITVTCLVTISVHGTLVFQGDAFGATGIARATADTGGKATGYTAVKVA